MRKNKVLKRAFVLPIWGQFWQWRADVHYCKWASNPQENEHEFFKALNCIRWKFLRR